jgi:hypothetical protein
MGYTTKVVKILASKNKKESDEFKELIKEIFVKREFEDCFLLGDKNKKESDDTELHVPNGAYATEDEFNVRKIEFSEKYLNLQDYYTLSNSDYYSFEFYSSDTAPDARKRPEEAKELLHYTNPGRGIIGNCFNDEFTNFLSKDFVFHYLEIEYGSNEMSDDQKEAFYDILKATNTYVLQMFYLFDDKKVDDKYLFVTNSEYYGAMYFKKKYLIEELESLK